MNIARLFFSKIRALFSVLKKDRGNPSPFSYTTGMPRLNPGMSKQLKLNMFVKTIETQFTFALKRFLNYGSKYL